MAYKIIDSCIWVSLFYKYDSNNTKAESRIQEISAEKFFVTDYIILETMTVLLQKVGKETADNFFYFIQGYKNCEIIYSQKQFFHSYVTFFVENDYKKLSFIDQSLLCLSKEFEIITFDKELLKAI